MNKVQFLLIVFTMSALVVVAKSPVKESQDASIVCCSNAALPLLDSIKKTTNSIEQCCQSVSSQIQVGSGLRGNAKKNKLMSNPSIGQVAGQILSAVNSSGPIRSALNTLEGDCSSIGSCCNSVSSQVGSSGPIQTSLGTISSQVSPTGQIVTLLNDIQNCCQSVSATTCQTEIVQTDLPKTINSPGVWCVKTALTVPCDATLNPDQFGIKVAVSNVTLIFYPTGSLSKNSNQAGITDDPTQNLVNISIQGATIINTEVDCTTPAATNPAGISSTASGVSVSGTTYSGQTASPQGTAITLTGSQGATVTSFTISGAQTGISVGPNGPTSPTSVSVTGGTIVGTANPLQIQQVAGGLVASTTYDPPLGSGLKVKQNNIVRSPIETLAPDVPTTTACHFTGCTGIVVRDSSVNGFDVGILFDDVTGPNPVQSLNNAVVHTVIANCTTAGAQSADTAGGTVLFKCVVMGCGTGFQTQPGAVSIPRQVIYDCLFTGNTQNTDPAGTSLETCAPLC